VKKTKKKETKDKMDELMEKFAQIGIKLVMQTNNRKDVKCYKCNKYGHIIRNCNGNTVRSEKKVI
jgi:hypothetical protein